MSPQDFSRVLSKWYNCVLNLRRRINKTKISLFPEKCPFSELSEELIGSEEKAEIILVICLILSEQEVVGVEEEVYESVYWENGNRFGRRVLECPVRSWSWLQLSLEGISWCDKGLKSR